MFVTKLPCRQDLNGNAEEQVNKFVYIFPDVDCLTSACKMLYDIPLRGGSAYYDKAGGKYYLVLNGDIPYISEFIAKRCNDPAEEYLCEYCKMISDKAVERLSSLA